MKPLPPLLSAKKHYCNLLVVYFAHTRFPFYPSERIFSLSGLQCEKIAKCWNLIFPSQHYNSSTLHFDFDFVVIVWVKSLLIWSKAISDLKISTTRPPSIGRLFAFLSWHYSLNFTKHWTSLVMLQRKTQKQIITQESDTGKELNAMLHNQRGLSLQVFPTPNLTL